PTTADTLVVPMSRPTTISDLSILPFMTLLGTRARAPASMPWAIVRGQVSAPRFSSFHPHDDTFGVRFVIQEDDGCPSATGCHLLEDMRGAFQRLTMCLLAQSKDEPFLSHDEGRGAVVGDVNLLERVLLR